MCVCVCVYVCMCVWVCACVCAVHVMCGTRVLCVHVHAHMCKYVCVTMCVCMCMNVHIRHVCMCLHGNVCVCVCECVCVCGCGCVHEHARVCARCVYMYTHMCNSPPCSGPPCLSRVVRYSYQLSHPESISRRQDMRRHYCWRGRQSRASQSQSPELNGWWCPNMDSSGWGGALNKGKKFWIQLKHSHIKGSLGGTHLHHCSAAWLASVV